MSPYLKLILLGLIGIVFCSAGITLWRIFPSVLHTEISKFVVLQNGSDSFNDWVSPPMPIYMQFYMFEIMNQDEIKTGAKPSVRQRGPYTYRERRPKIDIVFNGNETVSYLNPRYYYFDRDMSVGEDTDMLTVLNIPYVTIATMLEFQSTFVQEAFSVFAEGQGERLFIKKSVKDILWGYDDVLFNEIHRWLPKMNVPEKFGIFYGQNTTDDGLYTVYTGEGDARKFTEINRWNRTDALHWWTTKECNMINGTDGTTYHPFIDKAEKLYLYSTDICRSVYVIYENEVEIRGIKAYKFTAPPELFLNSTVYPDNAGFCTPSDNCLDSGVLNISNCKQGAPVVVSAPHFYMGSDRYIYGVDGLNPNKEEHEIFMTLEPETGVMLQAARRMQINIAVKPFEHIMEMHNLRDTILPVVYLNESVFIDEKTANTLKKQAILPQNIVSAVQYAAICFGSIIVLAVLITGIVKYRKGDPNDQRPLLSSVSSDI